ncbi:hypothetical protein EVAR_63069_1 [Eumeta japonica]|uniref:Uncharacterized protein n=1 Tax=Eumeta variegata TaxID=151549 RepID=A0A4C1Z8H1_EUMVA|nr:hypothetical protein EVAR_63069_1 [Eumeta japonica]
MRTVELDGGHGRACNLNVLVGTHYRTQARAEARSYDVISFLHSAAAEIATYMVGSAVMIAIHFATPSAVMLSATARINAGRTAFAAVDDNRDLDRIPRYKDVEDTRYVGRFRGSVEVRQKTTEGQARVVRQIRCRLSSEIYC